MAERKPHSRRFGWCIDNMHDKCRVAYIDWNSKEQVCTCDCHKETKDETITK